MSSSRERLQRMLLIGPHYSMERFGVLVLFVGLLMSVLIGWGAWTTYTRHRTEVATQAVILGESASTLTGTNASIVGISEDETRRHAAVLVSVADMSELSSSASDYQLIVSGRDKRGNGADIETPFSARMYLYGRTGYLALVLDATEPFSRQVVDLLLANVNQSMLGEDGTSLSDTYDIFQFAVNLGADGVYDTEAFTSTGEFKPDVYYEEFVTLRSEKEIRSNLDRDLKTMKELLVRIKEYERRVESDGLAVTRPEWIGDDSFEDDGDGLSLKTSYVAPGGFDFDWRSGSIRSGYVNSLMSGDESASDEGMSPSEWIALRRTQQSEISYASDGWVMKDGTDFEVYAAKNESTRVEEIRSDIEMLESAWTSYASLKSDYQITQLTDLLQLEVDANSMKGNYSVSNDEYFLVDGRMLGGSDE